LFNENFQSLTVHKKATLGRLITSTGWINLVSKNPCRDYSVKKDTLLVFTKSLILGESMRTEDPMGASTPGIY